jgi:uncharacterized repeat protein (TIGR01451 family)
MYLPLASLIVLGVLSAPAAPGVSVTLSNDSGKVQPASAVEYTIRVRNDSATAYPGVLIAQMLPQTLSYRDSTAEPSAQRPFEVQWQRDLPAHGETVLRFTATLSQAVQAGTTISTTACVRASQTEGLVCASDKDTVTKPSRLWQLALLAAGSTLAAGGLVWLTWRRRHRLQTR